MLVDSVVTARSVAARTIKLTKTLFSPSFAAGKRTGAICTLPTVSLLVDKVMWQQETTVLSAEASRTNVTVTTLPSVAVT